MNPIFIQQTPGTTGDKSWRRTASCTTVVQDDLCNREVRIPGRKKSQELLPVDGDAFAIARRQYHGHRPGSSSSRRSISMIQRGAARLLRTLSWWICWLPLSPLRRETIGTDGHHSVPILTTSSILAARKEPRRYARNCLVALLEEVHNSPHRCRTRPR